MKPELLIAAGLLALSLSACGGASDPNTAADAKTAEAKPTDAKPASGAAHGDEGHADEGQPGHEHAEGEAGHGEQAGQAEAPEGTVIAKEIARRSGIGVAAAGPGTIADEHDVQGLITPLEGRVARITARYPGPVRSLRANIGDAVKAGQTLAFTGPKTGCRAYIAFAGGLALEPAMGSRSTYLKAKIGGYQGRKLDKDDEIAFRAPVAELPRLASRFITPPDLSAASQVLRVVMGPQDDMFTEQGVATFLSATYTVTPQTDRMGCRLDGEIIGHVKDGNIISDGIAFGAVQVPSEGKPIIMLADRQTVGGYTKIATVISADLPIIAQAKPGEKIRFAKISISAAQQAYLADKRWLAALKAALALPSAR